MLNKTKILLMTPLITIGAFVFVFMAGYLGDLVCTAEQSGRGECDRLSDGQNNILTYASAMFYVFMAACSFGSATCIIVSIVTRCPDTYNNDNTRWGNRITFGENLEDAQDRLKVVKKSRHY